MSVVNVTNIGVLNNPGKFVSPFQFEVTFSCEKDLQDDLEWTLTYVGSAESNKHDQVLDSVAVGPVIRGTHKFILQADPPNPELIPPGDILGVTVCIITCSYREKEFIRIGYYVNNEYDDPNGHGAVLPTPQGETEVDAMDIGEIEGEEEEEEEDGIDEFYDENSDSANGGAASTSSQVRPKAMETGGRIDPAFVSRNILADQPRVTRFVIQWD